MQVLVVYDSVFGNTEKIALAVGSAVSANHKVQTLRVRDVKPELLSGPDLLIVGSPTRQFTSTPAIKKFLLGIPDKNLTGIRVAVFDTRIALSDINSSFGRFFIRTFGYAAEKMQRLLLKKGGTPASTPEGFLVDGTEGPLKAGELERAGEWAIKMCQTI